MSEESSTTPIATNLYNILKDQAVKIYEFTNLNSDFVEGTAKKLDQYTFNYITKIDEIIAKPMQAVQPLGNQLLDKLEELVNKYEVAPTEESEERKSEDVDQECQVSLTQRTKKLIIKSSFVLKGLTLEQIKKFSENKKYFEGVCDIYATAKKNSIVGFQVFQAVIGGKLMTYALPIFNFFASSVTQIRNKVMVTIKFVQSVNLEKVKELFDWICAQKLDIESITKFAVSCRDNVLKVVFDKEFYTQNFEKIQDQLENLYCFLLQHITYFLQNPKKISQDFIQNGQEMIENVKSEYKKRIQIDLDQLAEEKLEDKPQEAGDQE